MSGQNSTDKPEALAASDGSASARRAARAILAGSEHGAIRWHGPDADGQWCWHYRRLEEIACIIDREMRTPNDKDQPRPSGCSALLAELKRHLEITGYEARGGNWRRHRRDSILEDASATGLRALAQLEAECERIGREATHP